MLFFLSLFSVDRYKAKMRSMETLVYGRMPNKSNNSSGNKLTSKTKSKSKKAASRTGSVSRAGRSSGYRSRVTAIGSTDATSKSANRVLLLQ